MPWRSRSTTPSPSRHSLLATWWLQAQPATNYVRCELPARYLPGQILNLDYEDLVQDGESFAMPRQKGAAIWPFSGNRTRGALMALQQQNGTKVLLEVDDNYLVMWPHSHLGSEWRQAPNNEVDDSSIDLHRKYATWVDGIICATEHLATIYRKHTPKPVYVCENTVDPRDWPEPARPSDGVLRIGWAASASHVADMPLIRRALLWASKQDGVEVHILGQLGAHHGWGFKPKQVAWTDTLQDYRASLGILDVGVCPLLNNAWSQGKSDLKALEYAMAGAFPIVSDVPAYQGWKGPTIRCDSAKSWERALRWVVLHRDEIKQLAAAAQAYVLANRTTESNIWRWREAVAHD